MKPLVKDPNITLDQLIAELDNPMSFAVDGSLAGETHAHDVLAAISQKVMRVLRKASKKAEKNQAIKERLEQLEMQWGVAPDKLHQHLHTLGPKGALDFVRTHHNLVRQIAEVKQLIGSEYMPIIARHEDELMQRVQSYGAYSKPEDYLQSFSDFILQQVNQSVALSVVVNRPKDLTRDQKKCACCSTSITTTKQRCKPPGAARPIRTSRPASSAIFVRPRSAKPCCRSNSALPTRCSAFTHKQIGHKCSASGWTDSPNSSRTKS